MNGDSTATLTIYECEICGSYHPWTWDGDCREDANRYASPEDYADRNGIPQYQWPLIEVRSMDERVEADER